MLLNKFENLMPIKTLSLKMGKRSQEGIRNIFKFLEQNMKNIHLDDQRNLKTRPLRIGIIMDEISLSFENSLIIDVMIE